MYSPEVATSLALGGSFKHPGRPNLPVGSRSKMQCGGGATAFCVHLPGGTMRKGRYWLNVGGRVRIRGWAHMDPHVVSAST